MRAGEKLTVFLLHLAIAGTIQGHVWAEFGLLVEVPVYNLKTLKRDRDKVGRNLRRCWPVEWRGRVETRYQGPVTRYCSKVVKLFFFP